jgi:hypothetical protein
LNATKEAAAIETKKRVNSRKAFCVKNFFMVVVYGLDEGSWLNVTGVLKMLCVEEYLVYLPF